MLLLDINLDVNLLKSIFTAIFVIVYDVFIAFLMLTCMTGSTALTVVEN